MKITRDLLEQSLYKQVDCLQKMSISIVVPVYNEALNLRRLFDWIKIVLDKTKYEVIFIDDGSTDRSYEIMKLLQKNNKNIRIIRFQKNFGKSAGLMAGFDAVKNDIVITMDGDLQDDPREIPRFIAKIKSGYDMVSGWKHNRKDPLGKTIPSRLFNSLATLLTGVRIHDFNCGFKAYRKNVVKNVRLYGELHRYIPVLAAIKGYRIGEIKVLHHKRKYGKSKYGFSRLLRGMFDLITVTFFLKYAQRPLHFFGSIGVVSFAFGFIGGLYLVFLKLIGQSISNRPLLVLVVLALILGGQFISLGLLAELIIRNRHDKEYVIK